MTTAHRPTWKAAVGQSSTGGWTAGGATSSAKAVLSLTSHSQLKIRKGSQAIDRQKALKESLLKLEEAENKAPVVSKRRPISQVLEEEGRLKLLQKTEEVDDVALAKKYDDEDAGADEDSGGGWSDVDNHADGDSSKDDLDASSDDDDDSSDDEDDEAALQAELAKIRSEREAEKQRQAEEEAKQEESKLQEAALLGNPLLAASGVDMTGKLKRKWNDDVVFRNQAKGEPEVKKRFINDTIRNDFHKRFLNKFIR
jgi:protein CWC15